MKNGGAGMQIDYGFAETPFGEALIAENKRGVWYLSLLNGQGRNGARDFLMLQWPNAKLHRNDARIAELSTTIFTRRREGTSRRPLRAFVRGTLFQLRVWRALLRVPSGALTTYGRLAEAIGQSRAARAVGSAVCANPISFIIPCHRVIRDAASLGNYGGGRLPQPPIRPWY